MESSISCEVKVLITVVTPNTAAANSATASIVDPVDP